MSKPKTKSVYLGYRSIACPKHYFLSTKLPRKSFPPSLSCFFPLWDITSEYPCCLGDSDALKKMFLAFHPVLLNFLLMTVVLKQASKSFVETELLIGFLISHLENEYKIYPILKRI